MYVDQYMVGLINMLRLPLTFVASEALTTRRLVVKGILIAFYISLCAICKVAGLICETWIKLVFLLGGLYSSRPGPLLFSL